MADKVIEFPGRKPDGGNDGFGELFATLYLYEHGHAVSVDRPGVTPADLDYRRELISRVFLALTNEATAVHQMSGEDADLPAALIYVRGNGHITHWLHEGVNTLERLQWLQRALISTVNEFPIYNPYAAYHANTNQPPEPKP